MIKEISTVFLFVIIISTVPIGNNRTEHIGKNTMGPEAVPQNLTETRSIPVLAQVTGEIKLDEDEQGADVGPGQNGLVLFPGTVTVNTPVAQVELSVNAQGLECSVYPTSFIPQTGVAYPFQAVVQVPNFTSCAEEHRIWVTGMATTQIGGQSYPLDPAKGIVKVNQYCMANVTPEVLERSIRGGESKTLRFQAQNSGNGKDNFSIHVRDADILEEMGIIFEIDGEETTVPEGGTAEMSMTVSVSEKAPETKIMIEYYIKTSTPYRVSAVGVGRIELDVEPEPPFFSAGNWVLYAVGAGVILVIAGIVFIFIRRRKRASSKT